MGFYEIRKAIGERLVRAIGINIVNVGLAKTATQFERCQIRRKQFN
jgi:hypothetical protein